MSIDIFKDRVLSRDVNVEILSVFELLSRNRITLNYVKVFAE